MKVFIIRHGRVNYKWSTLCSSGTFDKECSEYDKAPLMKAAMQSGIEEQPMIYISSLRRSRETAEKLWPDADYIETYLVNEVPLCAGFVTKWLIPLWIWNILGRIQWFLNSPRQREGIAETRERAQQFINVLCENNTDSAIITHGFYMHTLLKEMKASGFKVNGRHCFYRNEELIIAER